MKNQKHLTQSYPDNLAAMIAATYRGQAHWARSGPSATSCQECCFYGYSRQVRDKAGNTLSTVRYRSCKKYHELIGQHGPTFPPTAAACKYFQRYQPGEAS